MDLRQIASAWPHSSPDERRAWTQYVRFCTSFAEEDLPLLLTLYRTVLSANGTEQRAMEEALLTALARLGHAAALPLFRELLLSEPPPGVTPLAEVVEALADIAASSRAEEALTLLEACLYHQDVDARDMATTCLVRAYRQAGLPVPERVVAHLHEMLRRDPVRRVRFSAGLALQELGEIDLVEIIFWAEDMAGWEEDRNFAIDDGADENWLGL